MAKQSERGQENIVDQLKELAVPIDNLHPDPANARKHNDKNLDAIKASLAKFGQRKPIVVQREGMIVRAGNGTLAAAKALGWKNIAAVVLEEDNATASQFAIADNRTAELAEWDTETLATLLDGMDEQDRDLLGFDAEDIKEMLGELEPEVVEDEVPEPPADPITKRGDLWVLGEHRLLCGDSTKAEDVERLMAGAKAGMMVTDPPYGVEYDAGWRNEAMPQKNDPSRQRDGQGRATGAVVNDDRADWFDAWRLFDGDVAYVWHAGNMAHIVAESLIRSNLQIRSQIIWAKNQLVIGRGDYHPQHEPCWYCVRKDKPGRRTDDRKQTTLWQIDKPRKSETGHSTQKPVECMARPMRNHEADSVYDPFLGSGTTLIAAEQLGRKCYGMEISPTYCDVIVKRWETLTGKKGVLANG